MKKVYVIIALSLSYYFINAQTFHGIIVAATKDPNIGKSVFQDYYKMENQLNTIAVVLNMKYKEYYLLDDDFNLTNLDETINNLQCSKDDIVFFYYSGHGVRANDEKTKFPQLAVCYNCNDNTLYPLYKIVQRIIEKKPKLCISIADACNNIDYAITPKQIVGEKSNTVINPNASTNLRKLFSSLSGSIIATSSMPGETSIALPNGGAFTNCFLNELDNAASGSINIDWNTILKRAEDETKKYVNRTPVYDIKIDGVGGGNYNPPSPGTDFISGLIEIANSSNTEKNRRDLVNPNLNKYFSSLNSKIEIMGKNGTTVVKRESALDYLKELSTSFKLIKIVELSSIKDENGKIKELKVHHIYKQ